MVSLILLDSSAARLLLLVLYIVGSACLSVSIYVVFTLVSNTQGSPYISIMSQNHEIFLILKLARNGCPFLYHCMPLYPSFPMHDQLPLADGVQQNEPYCRKIFSKKSNFIAVEHKIMKKYIYKLHNFKRRHWELSLSRVWNENERFCLVFLKMLVSCLNLGLCIRALVS